MGLRENKALFWVLFKNVFEIKNILLIFIVVFFISIFPISLFPFLFILSTLILFIIIFVGGTVFNSTYKFKQSTLFLSFNKKRKFKIYFYLQTLILMLIFILVALMFLMLLFLIYNELNLLIYYWPWENHDEGFTKDFRITNSHYILWVIMYNALIETLLLFSMSFMLRNVLKTQRSYLVFLLTLIIFAFTFGTVFNNCFSASSMHRPSAPADPYFVHFNNGYEKLFGISLLFPFYAPAQIIITVFHDSLSFALRHPESLSGENFNHVDAWHWYTNDDNIFFAENLINPLWHWNILYVLPVVEIFSFSLIGLKLN